MMFRGRATALLAATLLMVTVAAAQYGDPYSYWMDPYGMYGMDPYGMYGMGPYGMMGGDPMQNMNALLGMMDQQQRQLEAEMLRTVEADRAQHEAYMQLGYEVFWEQMNSVTASYRERANDYSTPDDQAAYAALNYYCGLRQAAYASCVQAVQIIQGAQQQYPQLQYGTGAAIDAMIYQLGVQQADLAGLMGWTMYASAASSAENEQTLVDWYREQTGDYTTQDPQDFTQAYAYYCSSSEAARQDCQAAEEISRQSAEAIRQSNAAFQSRMDAQKANFESWRQSRREASAAFDRQREARLEGQIARDIAHDRWLNVAILGNDEYAAEGSSTTEWMPYAPNPNEIYPGPGGSQMIFNWENNTWYILNPDGSTTPYYGVR